jgi:hypothetical protein
MRCGAPWTYPYARAVRRYSGAGSQAATGEAVEVATVVEDHTVSKVYPGAFEVLLERTAPTETDHAGGDHRRLPRPDLLQIAIPSMP